jgi:sigma-B regulation protein RsbU (phosphoserine phosphatase)
MAYAYLLHGQQAQALSAFAPMGLLAAGSAAAIFLGHRLENAGLNDSFEIHPREVIVNERARLDAEFAVAAQAQQRLLPDRAPRVEGFTIAGSCTPAHEVGGDLFDYMPLPDGNLGLCVADVSGKGVQGALYMTLTKGMLASAQPQQLTLPALASRLNRHLLATGRRKTFVTMSLATLAPAERKLTHIRAGHNPPLLFRAATGDWSLLKPRGLGLGLASPPAFDRLLEQQEVRLDPGDVAVLYSDGLTEMMNADNELYGEDRLAAAVRSAASHGAQAIHDAILDSARTFQGEAEQHDDLTLLVLKAEIPVT